MRSGADRRLAVECFGQLTDAKRRAFDRFSCYGAQCAGMSPGGGRDLDRQDYPARRRASELARQFDRIRDPQVVRGNQARRRASIDLAEAELLQRAGRCTRTCGINQNRGIRAVYHPDQRGARPIGHDYLAIRRRRLRKRVRDFKPGGIVAERTADADDPNQWRSISSRRKCVEHEMHGS